MTIISFFSASVFAWVVLMAHGFYRGGDAKACVLMILVAVMLVSATLSMWMSP